MPKVLGRGGQPREGIGRERKGGVLRKHPYFCIKFIAPIRTVALMKDMTPEQYSDSL